jgi:DnaJ-class molecular chaperone
MTDPCPTCHGEGKLPTYSRFCKSYMQCPMCEGTGQSPFDLDPEHTDESS